jgi:hypothetical protein
LNPFALDVGKASLAEYGYEMHIENISIVFLRRVLQSGQHHRYPILCDEISVASLGLRPIRAAVNWVQSFRESVHRAGARAQFGYSSQNLCAPLPSDGAIWIDNFLPPASNPDFMFAAALE